MRHFVNTRYLIFPLVFGVFLGDVAYGNSVAPDCSAEETQYEVIRKILPMMIMGWYGLEDPQDPRVQISRDVLWNTGEVNIDDAALRLERSDGSVFLSLVYRSLTQYQARIFLRNINTQNVSRSAGSWECEADVELLQDFTDHERTDVFPITYRSELTDHGRTHSVSGILVDTDQQAYSF